MRPKSFIVWKYRKGINNGENYKLEGDWMCVSGRIKALQSRNN